MWLLLVILKTLPSVCSYLWLQQNTDIFSVTVDQVLSMCPAGITEVALKVGDQRRGNEKIHFSYLNCFT